MKKLIPIILIFCSTVVFGQTSYSKEEANAALIYNVTRYVEWEKVDGDFEIVILNQPKISEYMKKYYANKKIGGAIVKIIDDKTSRTDFSGVEILISNHKMVNQDNMLSVNIDDTNGILNLVEIDGKIKMKMRKSTADKHKLKVSSSLTSMVELID